jgi:TM2 domain-containing membrane protein YozV
MSRNPSPVIAAALSLIFPGLGQIYAGAVRRGVLWALPTLALIVLRRDRHRGQGPVDEPA